MIKAYRISEEVSSLTYAEQAQMLADLLSDGVIRAYIECVKELDRLNEIPLRDRDEDLEAEGALVDEAQSRFCEAADFWMYRHCQD